MNLPHRARRIRQCFKDNGSGDTCALEHGHNGPHGWEDKDLLRAQHEADRQREYFRLWLSKEKN